MEPQLAAVYPVGMLGLEQGLGSAQPEKLPETTPRVHIKAPLGLPT